MKASLINKSVTKASRRVLSSGSAKVKPTAVVTRIRPSAIQFVRVRVQKEIIKVPRSSLKEIVAYLKSLQYSAEINKSVADENDLLSTQEAADLLNVSRPFVVKLIENNQIPAVKVGTHRRLLRKHVLAHMEGMRIGRQLGLKELAEEAQKLGLGY